MSAVRTINDMPTCFLSVDLATGEWVVQEHLPTGVALTAGEDDNDYAIVDISHWTQDDLDAFDSMELGDRLPIVESLEFGEFAKQLRRKGVK